jgi:hypothetical protein
VLLDGFGQVAFGVVMHFCTGAFFPCTPPGAGGGVELSPFEFFDRLAARAAGRGREAFITINNEAEGSAPCSVVSLAAAIVA